jgi:hypothetical protein
MSCLSSYNITKIYADFSAVENYTSPVVNALVTWQGDASAGGYPFLNICMSICPNKTYNVKNLAVFDFCEV